MDTYNVISYISRGRESSLKLLHTVKRLVSVCFVIVVFISAASQPRAQTILFDFDNAPLFTSLPIYQTAGGITAHLTATGQGYSIQNANVLGFIPQGFAGRIIYPNSINLADLIIQYDHTMTAFSIMYCPQELGCDDSATMQVRAYLGGVYVGANTRTATFPGTWPVDTLSCNFPQGFDSVVVHYLSHPPTCADYGVIFLADNMVVTPLITGIPKVTELPQKFLLMQNYPNPFNPATVISYQIPVQSYVSLKIYDVLGSEVVTLVNGIEQAGYKSVKFNAESLSSGLYYYRLQAGNFTETKKLVLLK